jgi:hypothetical protein
LEAGGVLYEDLYEISKLLLAEDDAERAPEVLLRRLVERCGAETGFVVVREDGSYQQKFEVGEERGRRSDLERRFRRIAWHLSTCAETEAPASRRKPPATATPSTYRPPRPPPTLP